MYRVITVTVLARALRKLISAEIAILAACASETRGTCPVDSARSLDFLFMARPSARQTRLSVIDICTARLVYGRCQKSSAAAAAVRSRYFGVGTQGSSEVTRPSDQDRVDCRVPLFHNSARIIYKSRLPRSRLCRHTRARSRRRTKSRFSHSRAYLAAPPTGGRRDRVPFCMP